MSQDYPFRAEYAKSNRAACKLCKDPIAKDSLRLAVMVQSPFFDGKQPNWFHYSCFWSRGKPTAVTEFAAFDSLRWEDQERIKNKITGGTGTSSKGKKAAAAAEEESNFSSEYAKTGQSKCRGCEDKIAKAEVRLGVKDYTSQRALMYGPQTLWYHVDCFKSKRTEIGFTPDMNPDKMSGFASLSDDDQTHVIEKLGKGVKGAKRKTAGTSAGPDSKKSRTDESDAEKKLLQEQSKLIWSYRDTLKSEVSSTAMKGLLQYNNQQVVNSEDKLLDRLSDGMAFGALSKCPDCKEGQLVSSSDGYHCTGNLSSWTRCTYTTTSPKRVAFKIPPEYHDVPFLKSYKYVKRERVFAKANLIASQVNHMALHGLNFYIHGVSTSSKSLLKSLISALDGQVVSKLSSSVSAVISTQQEVDKMNKKMKEVQELDIPVLAEGFVEACKGSKPVDIYKSYKLSSWGKSLDSAFTDIVDKGQHVLKSAAVRAAEARAEMAFIKDEGLQKQLVKGGAAVDPESELDSVAHILQEAGKPVNAVLSMVDIKGGANSYYKLQALEHDKHKRYWLFRSWGRIGTTIGGTKTEQFASKSACLCKFMELFFEKTGNDWAEKEYEKRPGKFFPVEIDYGQEDEELKLKAQEEEAGKTSKLPPSVQQLIQMIFDIDTMKKTMLEFEIDMKKMPLGKISKKNIIKAYKLLANCQKLVDEKGSPNQLLDASNQFFMLIPHDFGMKKPPVLDKSDLIKAKIEMLDNLKEIECAYNLLKGSAADGKDPIDSHYEALNTKLEPLDKDSDTWQIVEDYTRNTHARTHSSYTLELDEVFTVKRAGEKSRYAPFKDLPNRKLLWHGSRLTNFAGILSQGLRIAPPEAPVTGYMFGKGIYFADMVSKSANYCYTSPSSPYGLLLLCEVALGNMHELGQAEYITKLPKGKHSVKGCGRTEPDPSMTRTLSDGVQVPLGNGVNANLAVSHTSLLYNEYIVYDVAQLNVKYLLKCKFNYKY